MHQGFAAIPAAEPIAELALGVAVHVIIDRLSPPAASGREGHVAIEHCNVLGASMMAGASCWFWAMTCRAALTRSPPPPVDRHSWRVACLAPHPSTWSRARQCQSGRLGDSGRIQAVDTMVDTDTLVSEHGREIKGGSCCCHDANRLQNKLFVLGKPHLRGRRDPTHRRRRRRRQPHQCLRTSGFRCTVRCIN